MTQAASSIDPAADNTHYRGDLAAEGAKKICISIVSHAQIQLIETLLHDISAHCGGLSLELILTINLEETLTFDIDAFLFPVHVLRNRQARGFGANHNAAFRHCHAPFFCVINPDIRLETDPFPALLSCLQLRDVAVVAPAVLNPQREIEDSVRHFPGPFGLMAKALNLEDGRYPVELGAAPFAADWVGGMFMLFRASDFAAVDGFDEEFFLYYEDVDICTRLWKRGRRVMACPQATVVHDARYASHHNLRYLRWHVSSMGRYFRKHLFRLPNVS